MVCSRGVRLNSGFFILSFCRSVKESIKESAFERRQELPAGTGAAPLCQPLKCGADYRDETAALKMKHSRRLWGERRTFSAVAAPLCRRRRRERGVLAVLSCQALSKAPSQTPKVPRLAPHLLGLVLIFVSLKQKLKKKSFVRRMTFFKQRFLYINISEGSISQRIKQNGLAMAKHNPFSSIFNGLPLKIEIKPRM